MYRISFPFRYNCNIPKEIGSNILNEQYRFLVKNPYFRGNSNLEKLEKNYSNVTTAIWMTPQQIYVKVKHGKLYIFHAWNVQAKKKLIK